MRFPMSFPKLWIGDPSRKIFRDPWIEANGPIVIVDRSVELQIGLPFP